MYFLSIIACSHLALSQVLVRPLDLFPHTNHFMTVLVLERVSQSDILHPHRGSRAAQEARLQDPTPRPPAPPGHQHLRRFSIVEGIISGTEPELVAGLSAEQQSWLDLNTRTYGPSFDRDKWVASLLEQNRRAVQGRGLEPAPVPAPRPPSPDIPPMPAFPVAPASQDPAEYAKYKAEYDAYTDWYNKYSTLYAAKQEKRTKAASAGSGSLRSASKPSGGETKLPDPNAVPPGVDPVAWRKYCNDTRDYYCKYKSPQAVLTQHQPSDVKRGLGFDSKKSMAEQIADQILSKRGLMGKFQNLE